MRVKRRHCRINICCFVVVESKVLARSNKMNLAYNEEVNLSCTGAGYPLPNVFWMSPNNSIIPRHLYTLPSEMTSEASVTFNLRTGGIYTCQGNNSIPETRISKSIVNLHSKQKPQQHCFNCHRYFIRSSASSSSFNSKR